MPLGAGIRLGPYQIQSAIGAGGMGEVYRARDARLNRDVAIKILPEQFAADPDRLARFDREARTISQLNHPNICALYDISAAPNPESRIPNPDTIQFLVLELVDGPTLADRIAQGAIPFVEALPIAKQIAEALEAGHAVDDRATRHGPARAGRHHAQCCRGARREPRGLGQQ